MILPIASDGEQTSAFKTKTGATPDLRMLREMRSPVGLLAYALLQREGILRAMCFIDNEYGEDRRDDIDAAGIRVTCDVNRQFGRQARRIRILAISPFSKRHHHIQVQWATMTTTEEGDDVLQMQPTLIANLFPPSKRQQEETDDEDRVGPRRGDTAKKLKKKRGRKAKAEREDAPRDTDRVGVESDSDPIEGGVADAESLSDENNQIQTSFAEQLA